MGSESGVYSIEEAMKEGLYTPKVSQSSINVFSDSRRSDMFNLCGEVANKNSMRLMNLRGVYQNEMDINGYVKSDYLQQIADIRASINRDLDEIERLFKESCSDFLVEKTLNNA